MTTQSMTMPVPAMPAVPPVPAARTARPMALLAPAALCLLAACGGGGGGGQKPDALPLFEEPELAHLRTLPGSADPVETKEENDARRRAQEPRAGWKGRFTTGPGPVADALEGAAIAFSARYREASLRHPVLSRNGVTVHGARAPGTEGTEGPRYAGATMDHAGFAVFAGTGPGGAAGIYARTDLDPAPGMPAADATWTGLMLGADRDGRALLMGDATLTYDFGDREVDVRLTGIVNLDTGREHSTPKEEFTDIGVGADDGRWEDRDGPRYVEVGFAGDGHAEAAGLFRTPEMMGAFGAMREKPVP